MSETGNDLDHVTAAVVRAQMLIDAGRGQEALDHASRALATDPGSAQALGLAAQAHLMLGHPDDALRLASDAVAQTPEAAWAHQMRCMALLTLGRPTDAVAAAEEAVVLQPVSWMALMMLSSALMVAGRPDEGEIVAQEAVERAPQEPGPHVALGEALAARIPRRFAALRGRKRAKAAAAAYEAALQIDPQHVGALQALGQLNLVRGRTTAAATAFSAAASLDPVSVGPSGAVIALQSALERTARVLFPLVWLAILVSGVVDGGAGQSSIAHPERARVVGLATVDCVALLLSWRLVRPWQAISHDQRPAVFRRLRRDVWFAAALFFITTCAIVLVAFAVAPQAALLGFLWLAALLAWMSAGRSLLRLRRRTA